ncbi:hypothetical protein HYW83_02455 [Candidatus Peregrinibacteria bacterium]|nr:hypothetical protein [Candidatus Peregrinibacteria bacterium]
MKNTTKVISGVLIVAVVIVAAVAFGNSELFQGKLTLNPQKITKVIKADSCNGTWTKVFATNGTQNDANVTVGSIDNLFNLAKNGCEFKIVRSKNLDIGEENSAIECDLLTFDAYPLSPEDVTPQIKSWFCESSSTTQYFGVGGGSGESIFDTTGASPIIENVGRNFGYSEYANGHGEIGYNWHETDGSNHTLSTEFANYSIFAR